jgi:glycosyltransferase involved in cell wall biosynthesis
MTLQVFTPAIGQQDTLTLALSLLAKHAHNWVSMTVIDNASMTPIVSKFAKVIRNEENKGMVGSLAQARSLCTTDILVYLHSDMLIYEPDWDTKILEAFEADDRLGLLGVVGAIQADADGGRSGTVCAFRNWKDHGSKPTKPLTPVALLDGCFMAFRKSMMDELNLPEVYGDGNEYFFYDKELSLTVTMASWKVGVINLECEHLGGQTSCSEEFTKKIHSDLQTHDTMYARSERRYIDKWKDCFPVRVLSDWTVHVGRKR